MVTTSGFTAEKITELIGDTILGVRVVNGERLIFTTKGGVDIDAGDIKGFTASGGTAAALPFTSAGGVAATNAQSALVELATDFTALDASKGDRADIKKIYSGRLRHICTFNGDGSVARTTLSYPNVFPVGYFLTPPQVFITPDSNSPASIAGGWSARAVTTNGFSVNALSKTFNDQTGWEDLYNLAFHWVATGL